MCAHVDRGATSGIVLRRHPPYFFFELLSLVWS